MKFRELRPWCFMWISKLQYMKTFPIGAYDKRDVRINRLIHRLYQRKALNEVE